MMRESDICVCSDISVQTEQNLTIHAGNHRGKRQTASHHVLILNDLTVNLS